MNNCGENPSDFLIKSRRGVIGHPKFTSDFKSKHAKGVNNTYSLLLITLNIQGSDILVAPLYIYEYLF